MRIIAGNRRGAKLTAPAGLDLRPTGERVREALFNVLDGGRFGDPYREQLVVDAFAGTGALGLEALSRGAAHAVFIEQAIPARKALFQNIRALRYEDLVTVIESDATQLRRPAPEPAGLVLLDPPYRENLGGPCLEALRAHGWIDAETLLVLELAVKERANPPDWLETLEERRYGAARLIFARQA